MRILGIDTSGKIASVAVTENGKVLWEKSVFTKLTHSQIILPMVKEALDETELDFDKIDCVAVADGPGSYTGLRIGIGAVKGMCLGCKTLQCAGISTLMSLAYNCVEFTGKIISVMRARPKIVYEGEFLSDGTKIKRLSPDRVCGEEEIFGNTDTSQKIMLTGDGAGEIKEKYFGDNNNVLVASAGNMLQKAVSLCICAEQNPAFITDADKLGVSYLQATKAEKDKAHRQGGIL